MKQLITLTALLLLATLSACSPATVAKQSDTATEKLIWSSSPERPAWTMEEPKEKDGTMWFVGLSGRFATEQLARDDAKRSATTAVVQYMGTAVKDQFERARTSFGLESNVVDPTSGIREYQKLLAVNLATKVKVDSFYQEKWQIPTGVAHLAYALVYVPSNEVDAAKRDAAHSLAQDAERQAKEAGDEVAKSQAMKAAEFWKQMEEQGVTK